MATRGNYKLVGRQARNATQLQNFANGVYVTSQVVPEGYAKLLVNYDIDDTGSFIRPKAGRTNLQNEQMSNNPGSAHISNYIYRIHNDGSVPDDDRNEGVATDLKDLVLSFGVYKKLTDLIPLEDAKGKIESFYMANFTEIKDNSVYDPETGDVLEPGDAETVDHKEAWGMIHYPAKTGDEAERFEKIAVNDWNPDGVTEHTEDYFGYVTARTVKDAWAFDKKLSTHVPYPVHTIVNNEVFVFAGAPMTYSYTPANEERNDLQYEEPSLHRMRLMHGDISHGVERFEEDKGENYRLAAMRMEAKRLTAPEAMTSGFNMLDDQPYGFENKPGPQFEPVALIGYEEENNTNKPMFVPDLGVPFMMQCYYTFIEDSQDLQYQVEYIETEVALGAINPPWDVIKDWTPFSGGGEGDPLWISITPKHENFTIRITFRKGSDDTTKRPFPKSFSCKESIVRRFRGINFDLSKAKGMVSWSGSVCVYGVPYAPDTIFCSVIDDPTYFPFPNNVLTFDSEILACYNYLDRLLVITRDSIWLVTAGPNIASSIMKRVMTNVSIPEVDALNVQILKDQIFFKTDTQFFVLKPNMYTSDATDLKNYTNSTAIANFCENFTSSVVELLNKVYVTAWQKYTENKYELCKFVDFNCTNVKSHIQNSDVHYVYTIEPIIKKVRVSETETEVLESVELHLIYNTVSRAWRIHMRAVGDPSKVRVGDVLFRNKLTGEYYEFFSWFDSGIVSVCSQSKGESTSENFSPVEGLQLSEWYDNFTYVDTGYPAIQDINTKRFRELQFTINSNDKHKLGFCSAFKVDGAEQVSATNYDVMHIKDPQDPDFGSIFVRPRETENLHKYQSTLLSETDEGSEVYWKTAVESLAQAWQIDLSAFPNLDTINISLELRGRGRRGSVQLLNTSLQPYQLSTWTWVYRLMTAR